MATNHSSDHAREDEQLHPANETNDDQIVSNIGDKSIPKLIAGVTALKIRINPTLLSLPRELRDMIYEYALVEPPLWYRRHKDGCPIRTPMAATERPVYLCSRDRAHYLPDTHVHPRTETRATQPSRSGPCYCTACDYVDNDKLKKCQSLCQGRSGLKLLRTCRQIYVEAEHMLYKNMFCFGDHELFLETFKNQPKEILRKVTRISLQEQFEWDWCNGFRPWQPLTRPKQAGKGPVRALLRRLQNLVELEIPPQQSHILSYRNLRSLSKLRVVRTVVLLRTEIVTQKGEYPWATLRIAKQITPIPCCWNDEDVDEKLWYRPSRHEIWPQLAPNTCFFCWQRSHEEDAWLWEGHDPWYGTTGVIEWISDRVQSRYWGYPTPAHRGPGATPAIAGWKPRGLSVGLIGLPVHGPKTRQKLQRTEQMLSLQPCPRGMKRFGPITLDKHLQAEKKNGIWKVEVLHKSNKEVAIGRQQKREMESKRMEVQGAKKAKKKIARSMRELSVTKKELRKRANR